jgi:hypothetical protein
VPHASRRAGDEGRAARPEPPQVAQRLECREARDRHRGRPGETERTRLQGRVDFLDGRVLGVTASRTRAQESGDRIAWPEPRDARPDPLDPARGVAPEHEREPQPEDRPEHPPADLPVDRVHPRRADADEDLAGLRLRRRDLAHLEPVAPAVPVDDHGLHPCAPPAHRDEDDLSPPRRGCLPARPGTAVGKRSAGRSKNAAPDRLRLLARPIGVDHLAPACERPRRRAGRAEAGPGPRRARRDPRAVRRCRPRRAPPWEGPDFFAGEPLPEGGALRLGGAGQTGRKRKRGRKGAKAAARRGMTVKEKAHFVFQHRHLIVKRWENLTESERDDLTRMRESLPELATPRRFADRIYGLFDPPKDFHQSGCRRAAIVRDPTLRAVPELLKAMEQLDEEKFPNLMAYLNNPVSRRVRTTNHVERDQLALPVPGEGVLQVEATPDTGAIRGPDAGWHWEGTNPSPSKGDRSLKAGKNKQDEWQ